MNTEPETMQETVNITTKYGPLVVKFGGERQFEEGSFDGRKLVTKRVARVYSLDAAPLKVNGVEYRVYGDLCYGDHFVWNKEKGEGDPVTGWHYAPDSRQHINREKHFGSGISVWTGDATAKAFSTIRDLMLETVNQAARTFPEAVTEGLRVWLLEQAENNAKEANKLDEEARDLDRKAQAMRERAAAL